MPDISRALILIALFCAPLAAQNMQKLNLPANPAYFRFTPATRAWPANHGQAAVCWWHNDAVAALSITIDDNQVAEHSWWKAQGQRLGFRFTWFVITGSCSQSDWNSFRDLVAAGHDAQSHTVNHLGSGNTLPAATCVTEYGGAITKIESEIPGSKCLTVAYPNGLGVESEAAKYYIAARGVYGRPNIAFQTWYMNTNSMHFADEFVDQIMNKAIGGLFWGGWMSIHIHHLGEQGGTSDVQARLDHIATYDSLWVGLWKDVARYGQSRDTKILTVNSVTDNMVRYTLADSMRDSIYNFPLTVKVRLDNSWDTCVATQNGRAVAATMITYSSKKYVLVQTIPDGGEVTLYSNKPSGIRCLPGLPAQHNAADRVMYDLRGRRVHGTTAGIYVVRDRAGQAVRKELVVR